MKKYGNKVVFAGGSPEKQIELLTKEASDNGFRGSVRYQKSPRDGKIYLQYVPKKSPFQNGVSGISNLKR